MIARRSPTSPVSVADDLDETRYLVGAAVMAVADFHPDERATALRTLLTVIEARLEAAAAALMEGRGN